MTSVPRNEQLWLASLERAHRTQTIVYILMVAYLIGVTINSITVVIVLWLRLLGGLDIPFDIIISMAIGSGGLGAGTLVFVIPLKRLFAPMA